MADLAHRASRIVDQRPAIVHDRLIELATRLRDETPPIASGSQAAMLLGVSGPIGIEVTDHGPSRIELRTTQGRILGHAVADIASAEGDRTSLALALEVEPQGMAANLMLGMALRTVPDAERRVIEALEAGLDDLATELAKPEAEWDAATWQPPGLPTRG